MEITVIRGAAVNAQLADRTRQLETELAAAREENARLHRTVQALRTSHVQLQADYLDLGRRLQELERVTPADLQSAGYLAYLTARLRAGGSDVCH